LNFKNFVLFVDIVTIWSRTPSSSSSYLFSSQITRKRKQIKK